MEESNKIEFKSELNDKLEKEVVAFLNYHEGGDIYIGIDDNGKAVNLTDIDNIMLIIADRIKNNISPATLGLFDIVKEKYQGKSIVRIIISSGPDKPYYIKKSGMSPKGCYIRIGTSSQPMETSQIDELYSTYQHSEDHHKKNILIQT